MMKVIKLSLKNRSYPIFIEEGLLAKTGVLLKNLNIGRDAIIITNKILKDRFSKRLIKSLRGCGFSYKFYTVPDSEKAKSIKYCFRLIDKISKYDKKRQVFLIALGGGVAGDLTGFIASIYKRGIAYVQIPTTLLSQIDSSIGGKTAIDLKIAKNLIGAFYQPKAVIIDPELLKSLPKEQMKSGLAEVIKYSIIKDEFLFSFLEKNRKEIFSLGRKAIEFIEERCINIKAKIVEKDEQEKKGIRTILNFGHTIGHAIESASRYNKYSHGQAISIGMICASKIANYLCILGETQLNKIINLIKLYGLAVPLKNVNVDDIMNSLARDKKFVATQNRLVLPKAIGRVIIKAGISESLIRKVILEYMAG